MVAILEHVAIAKAFGNFSNFIVYLILDDIRSSFSMHIASGKRLDATQEMMALGLANFLGSFFGSFPITASFGRSSVQAASGVRTPFANVYGGTYSFA